MKKHKINLEIFDKLSDFVQEDVNEYKYAKNDIAIVGLSVKAGSAENADELWNTLCKGCDLTDDISYLRAKDADEFANYLRRKPGNYTKKSYLNRIDMFSPGFFHIFPSDAALIDPAQRLFTLAAWNALEDAGYSKKMLDGSLTGVFVGYSCMPESYSELLAQSDPEYADRALAGKVNSIIASRLSYFLNLKGPAIMIDTACSSSLVAVHTACNSIRMGECEQAVVGGVKYSLVSEEDENAGAVTVESYDGKTRTFDISANGTNPGEGVAVVILKPLAKAEEEGNHIYAVIKGSAANQDGASVGITAPNASAQEDVIVKAWENAGIDPEKVSYIEAHGTATKLGDPIEISGIRGAFEKYTDRKQFCAVGSIKTNLGHLDCAAGILGLIKCVLAFVHKQIPPHLYFTSPNKEIDFIDSPVYINDILTSWTSDNVRICGVSSFGICGTNCHCVLQEYKKVDTNIETDERFFPMLLPLSAMSREKLLEVAKLFAGDVKKMPGMLRECVYTASLCKSEHLVRMVVLLEGLEDINRLSEIAETEAHDIRTVESADVDAAELVAELKNNLFNRDGLKKLAELYVEGANVDFRDLYSRLKLRTVSLSGYPMDMERCWAIPKMKIPGKQLPGSGTLIGTCLAKSPVVQVHSVYMNEATCSEIREHRIGEMNVLAGTVYVEMLHRAAAEMLGSDRIEIANLIFLAPCIFDNGVTREVQTVLYSENTGELNATVQSRLVDEDEWDVHVTAKVAVHTKEKQTSLNMKTILSRMRSISLEDSDAILENLVVTGPFWRPQKAIWIGEGEAATLAEEGEEHRSEFERYYLCPPLLDAAVNCSSVLNEGVFCLPYYYGSMHVYRRIPATVYSHTVKKKNNSSNDGEINVFDVVLFDSDGEVIATINDYAMKKMSELQKRQFFHEKEKYLLTMKWVQDKTTFVTTALREDGKSVVLVKDIDLYDRKLHGAIRNEINNALYELTICEWDTRNTEKNEFVSPADCRSIESYFDKFSGDGLSRVIVMLPELSGLSSQEELSSATDTVVQGFFNIMYALASNKNLGKISVDVVAKMGDKGISPIDMAVIGMGKSLRLEYKRIRMRCVIYDSDVDAKKIINELSYNHNNYEVLLRSNERLLPRVEETTRTDETDFSPKKGGTYLVTGGTCGIGLLIAELLAELEPDISLILASRSGFPAEDLDDEAGDRHSRICRLEERVSTLMVIACDVSDANAFSEHMKALGQIDGVVHSAGIAGGGFLLKRNWEDFRRVLSPKTDGTWNVIKLARDKKADFVVLFSSYSTVLPVAGQADYIGANSFMDAYSEYDNPDGMIKVFNWSGFSETGMALSNNVEMSGSLVEFLTNAQGAKLFAQAMSTTDRRILIGRFNYLELVNEAEDLEGVVHFSENISMKIRNTAQKVNRTTEKRSYDISVYGKDGPLTDTEQKIAQAWAQVLGIREIDYRDKFLEVGGDSLSANYLQKEINSYFPGMMDIIDVFVYSSIVEMAKYIDNKIDAPKKEAVVNVDETQQMKHLLEMLAAGKIDVSEAGKLI